MKRCKIGEGMDRYHSSAACRQTVHTRLTTMETIESFEMTDQPSSWDDLKTFVHTVLCEKENLIREQFPLEIAPLQRGERFCGCEFALFGPRQIRLGAIWSAEENLLLLYDSRGVRFQTIKLLKKLVGIPEQLRLC